MPILPREADVFPANLFEQETFIHDHESTEPWWAIYTLARREKDLMRRLRVMEIPSYCPLIPKKNRSANGRVRCSYIPLFPGYVFAQGDNSRRQEMLTTNCISRTLKVDEPDKLLADLRQIHQLVDANIPLTLESRIQAGQRIRVTSGPFKGVEGVVLSRRSEELLLVSVKFLQQGASVEIGDYQVERV